MSAARPTERRRAVAFDDGGPQAALGKSRRPPKLHPPDRMERDELVGEAHAGFDPCGHDTNVLEAAQSEEVRNGFADLVEVKGLSDARLDELPHGGVVQRLAFLEEPDLHERPIQKILNLRRARTDGARHDRGERRQTRDDGKPPRWAHQKVCLTRTSSE